MAPPGQIVDWRMVVLVDVAVGSGALAALPGTADDVAGRLGLDPHGVRVVLDALGAWGVVARDGDGRYTLGADAPDADAIASLRHHARAIRRWSTSLDKRVRGEPVEIRPGMPDPELFIDALAIGGRAAAPGLVDLCLARFPEARSVIDLGGGHGEYSLEFARRGLRVTLQDLPVMVDVVRSRGRLTQAGVELVAGSFFDGVPDGPFDIAFCTGITHTFDGDHCQTLFRNLRPVVSPAGGVAVVTFLRNRQPMADVFAVQMLANANGGDAHTEEEYRAWLGGAGFEVDQTPLDIAGRAQTVLFAS
jgi:2-polyprenyl-3-methyl-5-hydroxy-6-metoxy-1,4-benzoquinol methylase